MSVGTDIVLFNARTLSVHIASLTFFVTMLAMGCGKSTPPSPRVVAPVPETPIAKQNDEPAAIIAANQHLAWDAVDDPRKDGWDTEVLADQASASLKKLAAWIGDGDDKLVEGILLDQLVYAHSTPTLVYEDEFFSVSRYSNSKPEIVDRGCDRFLKNLQEGWSPHRTERTKFKIVSVESVEASSFTTEQYVSRDIQEPARRVEQHVTWKIEWHIRSRDALPTMRSIHVSEFEQTVTRRKGPLLVDCTASVLGKNESFSKHLAYGLNHWLKRLPVREMMTRFGTPGIALGDVNGDGFDDLYLCQEPGLPNRLFLQQADGSLLDVSREWGVDWIEDSRSALLVDLDNDGDQDLAVGIFGHVVIAKNVDQQKFEVETVLDVSESTASLAAADYDRDGKLDLYVCGYAFDRNVLDEPVSEMGVLSRQFVYHDAENGGANFLLRNETQPGGQIALMDVTQRVGLDANNRRWSLAAAWEDFDNDGDADLYVANDYGRNNLYRNDGGKFVDEAAEFDVEDSASGMSVTWGDYNLDGRIDLYVSNMFSSAGSRITSQPQFKPDASQSVRKRLRRFARGNTLFRNQQAPWADVSEQSGVTLGRWAWGSNFVDLNNDGWCDLVVANGYLSSEEDTGDL